MALVKSTQYGAAYVWGVDDDDAPTIAGMAVRGAQLEFAPEVTDEATDGEGHVEGAVESNSDNRMINATFTGYSTSIEDTAAAEPFTWADCPGGSRFFRELTVTFGQVKGKYTETTVKCKSNKGVTGTSSS